MNLTTNYMSLSLSNPIIASAGPATSSLDNIRRLEDCGAGAIVLPSMFEEQIRREQEHIDSLLENSSDTYGEALTYFPPLDTHDITTESYLALIEEAVAAVDIPVIASLNGVSDDGWINYAREIESAGASALELNIYLVPSNLAHEPREVEQHYVDIVRAVRSCVAIPLAVKVGPYFSAPGHMATAIADAGADALVLFNRFYQPDIDLSTLTVSSEIELSSPAEIRLALLWVGILSGRIDAYVAASTGVDSADEVVKYLLAGADVVMTTSALLRHGIEHMRTLCQDLEHWLDARDLISVDDIRGRMRHEAAEHADAADRGDYIRILQGYGT
ncbi:MAG: dihydroorotate dehydrogenase-like protein [Halioglobus sp.]|nr:dihydroorotate dehydrogenase-like protein [Halioglobus sp.]